MCIVCRYRFNQKSLLRLQIKNEKLLNFTNQGRSFYLCKCCISTKDCIKAICKINKIKNKDNINSSLKEIIQKWEKNKK
ncbi:DUF448 domain-containing protein [Helicobacter sp. MIT 14-3879]|uniref:DUF448 domain-containing protein n=1 Tax=Helicobacter sp. MIT 14-3879 TaxID=2040649 RepID=UPI002161ECF9|nr:DUF448 domain-containing protein [Helicobacter sp. MIT 14-3879]